MLNHFGIKPLHWLLGLSVLLIGLILSGWKKRQSETSGIILFPAWLIPTWFHVYFTIWFFISGFYRENRWMTIFALANLLLAVIIHMPRPAPYKSLKKI
jgi:Fe2+ transport system protein B